MCCLVSLVGRRRTAAGRRRWAFPNMPAAIKRELTIAFFELFEFAGDCKKRNEVSHTGQTGSDRRTIQLDRRILRSNLLSDAASCPCGRADSVGYLKGFTAVANGIDLGDLSLESFSQSGIRHQGQGGHYSVGLDGQS